MSDYMPGISSEVLKMAEEDEKKQKAEAAKVIEDIGEDFTLFSWGYSEPLKITRNGKSEYITLKIKSVGIGDIMESYQEKMPSPPSTKRMFKKGSVEARELGYNHDVILTQVDEGNPVYLEMKRKHDNEAGQEILLRGLCYDLKWDGKLVLKGKEISTPTEVLDKDGALKALRKMGLTAEHFGSIVKSIRELTADAEVEETRNL